MKALMIILLLLSCHFCFGQKQQMPVQPPIPRIQFEHLTVADGLPENSVRCMIQDHLGFMWLGTQNGLVRYDGSKMTVYQYDAKNAFSLKAKQIRTLFEDSKGDIWIGGESFHKFERATQRFIEYPRKSPDMISEYDWIAHIQADKQGDIWVFTPRKTIQGYVLDRFNPTTNTWTYFRHDPKKNNTLANNSIYGGTTNGVTDFSFVEDTKGKIWTVSTGAKENILHWFDRKTSQFIRYKPHGNPEVISNFKKITTITLDNKNQLYLSSFSGEGLFHLDPTSGKIEHFRHDPANANSIRCDTVAKVHQDKNGLVWLATIQGLDRLNPQTGIFTHFVSKPNDPTTPGAGFLQFVYEMPNGDSWFVAKKALTYYDRKNNQFVRYQTIPDDESSINLGGGFFTFFVDRTGLVWVGTWLGGLNKQSRITKFSQMKALAKDPKIQKEDFAVSVFEASSEPSVIWFGTTNGLERYDKKTGKYTHYQHDSLNRHSVSKGYILTMAEDKKGRFWLGSYQSGLNLMDRKTGKFSHFTHDPAEPNSLMDNVIHSLLSASDGTLWIGTNRGLDHFDSDKNLFTHYYEADTAYAPELFKALDLLTTPELRVTAIRHPGNSMDRSTPFTLSQTTDMLVVAEGNLGISQKYDYAWIEDSQGKIVWEMDYAKTRSDGIPVIRLQVEPIRLAAGTYRLRYKSNETYSYNDWSIAPPPYHPELWGVQLLKITTIEAQSFRKLANKKYFNGLLDGQIFTLHEDKNKQIWTGSNNGGLNRFDPSTGKFTFYHDHFKGPGCINVIKEDSNTGRFWLADYVGGLLLFDPKQGVLKKYTPANGLPSTGMRGIQSDEKGYLWLATQNGLCRFDPVSEKFQKFDKNNGLQSLEFFSSFKTHEGEIYFTGKKGVNSIFPEQVTNDPHPPQVVLTDLSIFGKPTAVGEDKPLAEDISIAKQLTLKYDQNDFTIYFAAIHFNRGNECQYAYRVVNYDKDWIQAGTQQQARYTGLPSGTYTFQVKAANADGLWNEKGVSIRLTILPPWWRTWWAYTLYIFAFGAILRAYIVYRSRALRRENRILEEKISLRTNQLEQKSNELGESLESLKTTQAQLIQKEKLASLGELTAGIAHEIQNPLNFVNNFSELSVDLVSELLEERNKDRTDARHGIRDEKLEKELLNELAQNQEKINFHGKRASSIVKGMLEHSRTGTGERQLTDMNQLADEYLRLSYHGLRAKDSGFNSDYELISDENLPEIEVVPQEIGRVLLNLINNAFYAVNERAKQAEPNYQPKVTVTSKYSPNGGWGAVRVQDNGTGMSEATKAKIFQPFFTTKPTGEGTGLGLSLAYDIVTKGHSGTLEVETKEGAGTTFIMKLPIQTH